MHILEIIKNSQASCIMTIMNEEAFVAGLYLSPLPSRAVAANFAPALPVPSLLVQPSTRARPRAVPCLLSLFASLAPLPMCLARHHTHCDRAP